MRITIYDQPLEKPVQRDVCLWCGQRIREVCSHAVCLRVNAKGFDTLGCELAYEKDRQTKVAFALGGASHGN